MRKYILTIFSLIILITASSAQEKNLTGIWECKKMKNNNGEVVDLKMGFYKIFNSDNTFSNMRLTPEGAILSHEGIYKLSGTNTYSETVVEKNSNMQISEQQTNLSYALSTDGKTLTLEGDVKLGNGQYTFKLYEEWKKVEVVK